MAEVIGLQIASDQSERQLVDQISLVAGKGVVGDRNFGRPEDAAVREVTLVSDVGVAAYNRDIGADIRPYDTLRNIIVSDVDFLDFVGKRFQVGEAELEGVEPCQPCAQLGHRLATDNISPAQVVKGLMDRAGLRARVIRGGAVRIGDAVSIIGEA